MTVLRKQNILELHNWMAFFYPYWLGIAVLGLFLQLGHVYICDLERGGVYGCILDYIDTYV